MQIRVVNGLAQLGQCLMVRKHVLNLHTQGYKDRISFASKLNDTSFGSRGLGTSVAAYLSE